MSTDRHELRVLFAASQEGAQQPDAPAGSLRSRARPRASSAPSPASRRVCRTFLLATYQGPMVHGSLECGDQPEPRG